MPDTWDTGPRAAVHTFQSMKLAMFGATGTVGSALVGKALAAGHELRVLARTPAKLTSTDSR